MNQKDYKEIAGIIKETFDNLISDIEEYKTNVMNSNIITAYGEEEHKARCMGYDDVITLLKNKRKETTNKFADYFEREQSLCRVGANKHNVLNYTCLDCGNHIFNKKQFIKDCGIEDAK